jgi:hypothetical protein
MWRSLSLSASWMKGCLSFSLSFRHLSEAKHQSADKNRKKDKNDI